MMRNRLLSFVLKQVEFSLPCLFDGKQLALLPLIVVAQALILCEQLLLVVIPLIIVEKF